MSFGNTPSWLLLHTAGHATSWPSGVLQLLPAPRCAHLRPLTQSSLGMCSRRERRCVAAYALLCTAGASPASPETDWGLLDDERVSSCLSRVYWEWSPTMAKQQHIPNDAQAGSRWQAADSAPHSTNRITINQ